MWSQAAYSRAPWSSGVLPATPPGQVLPPPVPGGTTSYTFSLAQGAYPWSFGSWSGGAQPVSDPPGGVIAIPKAESGVMSLMVWWPNAPLLQVVRITQDGTRTPVRGAYPLAPAGSVRENRCLNPSARAGLNGYVPGVGSPTLSQLDRDDIDGHGWRAAITTAGTDEVVVPVSLPAGQPVTVGMDLRLSGRPTGLSVTIGWVDNAGVALAPSVAAFTADQVNSLIGRWDRLVATLVPPAAAVQCSTLKVAATGLGAGATLDGSRITVEAAITDGSPFDGDTLGGLWLGTPELSASLLAPVAIVDDGECPLDAPVVYQVYNAALVGGSVSTPSVMLRSGDRSWLTHPAVPDRPIQCHVTTTPTPVRALQRTISQVIGRAKPVVITAKQRQAPAGTLRVDTETFAQRDELLTALEDGAPVLLRAPADYGYGPGQWLSLGDLTEDPDGRPAPVQGRFLSADYQEVDAPASAGLLGV